MPKRTKPSAVARTKPKTRAPRAARAAQPGQEHEEKTEMVVEGDEFEHPSQNHQEEEAPNDISLPLDMIHVISSFSDLKTLSKEFAVGSLWQYVEVAELNNPKTHDQILPLLEAYCPKLRCIIFTPPSKKKQKSVHDSVPLIPLFSSLIAMSCLTRLDLIAHDGRLFSDPHVPCPTLRSLRISCSDLRPILARPNERTKLASLESLSLYGMTREPENFVSSLRDLTEIVTGLRRLSIHDDRFFYWGKTKASLDALSAFCLKNTNLQHLSIDSRSLTFAYLCHKDRWGVAPSDPDLVKLSAAALKTFGVDISALRCSGTSVWSYFAHYLEKQLYENPATLQAPQAQPPQPPQNDYNNGAVEDDGTEDEEDEERAMGVDEPKYDEEQQPRQNPNAAQPNAAQNSFSMFEPIYQACQLTPAQAMLEIRQLIRSEWRGIFDQNMSYINTKILECLTMCELDDVGDEVAEPAIHAACHFLQAKYSRKYMQPMHEALQRVLLRDFRRIRFVTGPKACNNIIKDTKLHPFFCAHVVDMLEVRHLADAIWKDSVVIKLMADKLFALPDRHSASVIKRLGTMYVSLKMPHRIATIQTVLELLKGRLDYFDKLQLVMMQRLCESPTFFAYILAALADDEDRLDKFLNGLFDRRAVNKPWPQLRVAITLQGSEGKHILGEQNRISIALNLWRLIILSASSEEFFTNDINELLQTFPVVPASVVLFGKTKSSTAYETRIDPAIVKSVIQEKVRGRRVINL